MKAQIVWLDELNGINRTRKTKSHSRILSLQVKYGGKLLLCIQQRTLEPKSLRFAEKVLGKHALINETFQKPRSPLSLKHKISESNKKRADQYPYKFGSWGSITDNSKPKIGYQTCLNKSDLPIVDKEEDKLEAASERSSYFYLDSSLKNFLTGILNIQIPTVKIYTNQFSDTLANQFNADALTYKDKIFFKAGKYNPLDKKGVALLGHELTHAVQIRMQNQKISEATITNYAYEEQEAIDNEKGLLNYFSNIGPYNSNKKSLNENPSNRYLSDYRLDTEIYRDDKSKLSLNNSSNSTNNSKLHHTQVPRPALASRNLSLSPETNTSTNSTFQLSEQQLRFIKDDIYRDIMNRIRIEFERGG